MQGLLNYDAVVVHKGWGGRGKPWKLRKGTRRRCYVSVPVVPYTAYGVETGVKTGVNDGLVRMHMYKYEVV
jgi:hypothetical protein